MNYQAIRAVLENPLLTAYNGLVPAVPVYFDNIMNDGSDSTKNLVDVAATVLNNINNSAKPATGVYLRTGSIDGPAFSPDYGGASPDQQSRRAFMPFFISRISAGFQAQVLS